MPTTYRPAPMSMHVPILSASETEKGKRNIFPLLVLCACDAAEKCHKLGKPSNSGILTNRNIINEII